MARLIRFLIGLAARRFYGEIRVRFKNGDVHGQIEVHEGYLEGTLPQPDQSDPMYQRVVADVAKEIVAP